jgi:hypothetical protein
MMGLDRDRPRRRKALRLRPAASTEHLEPRQLLTAAYNYYSFSTVQARIVDPNSGNNFVSHPIGQSDAALAGLDNEGRYITGKDRQGDEYTLIVHGPGALIVTDATPNDGALDDDINTIQIVGSNPHTTYVTGQVTATARPIVADDTGVVYFNHLIAEKGVHSIILNGFTLKQTVPPIAGQPNGTGPDVYLPGGVKTLSFHDVINVTDLAGNGSGSDQPTQIVIGDPTTPLVQSPTITLDHIFNTVIDSTSTSQDGLGPQTDATVNILVNGNLHALNIGSATAQTITGGFEFNFPRIDVTGRTAVRAIGVDHLKVTGSARNFTASRAGTPFQPQNGQATAPPVSLTTTAPFRNGFSGLNHLKTAVFQGTADGVGLDVGSGNVGTVKFLRGAGDPTGSPLNATEFGFNAAEAGYPSRGLTGALVTANKIHSVVIGPSRLILQTAQDPDVTQLDRQGQTKFYSRPGQALVNAAIVSAGSIGSVNQVGLSQSSEIAAGYHYRSFEAGLEPVRAKAQIGKFRQRGDLVDSVVSASYRPNDGVYGNGNDTAGPGKITGVLHGRLYSTGAQTVLSNFGTGIYAKHKVGYLPPPEGPLRNARGVLKR